jgi:hypothetical protein
MLNYIDPEAISSPVFIEYSEKVSSLYPYLSHVEKFILSRSGGLCVTYRRVLDWVIGFIDTVYTPLGTTDSYSAIAISTLLHPLMSSVFTSRILATDS